MLEEAFERWDARGLPDRRDGATLSVPTRVVQVADAAERGFRGAGALGAIATVAEQSGRALDPALCDAFCTEAATLIEVLEAPSVWEELIDAEPGPVMRVSPARLDDVAASFGQFADLKSVWTLGHSIDVASLCEQAAAQMGLDAHEQAVVRRAGWLHDIGRTSVSNRVWDKPAALDHAERELVKLHAYQSERILSVAPGFREERAVAAAAHERCDSGGYPKGVASSALGTPARILAAADVLVALGSARPHRASFSIAQATDLLAGEVQCGHLDRNAVEAVLAAAGLESRSRLANPAGLTEREVEVLGALARGGTNKDIARELGITAKTVAHHVGHIYDKVGVRSRAGVALFAVDHGLL